MFALLIPDGFTQRCDHGITCHCRFRIQYNTHTHTRTYAHTTHYLCFASHKPLVRLHEPKFCMHMECDQSIKSHKNIKLIWGHLGYANEGQRSNLISFSISATVCPIELNFYMHMECDQTIILHNKIKLICGHLGYANEGQRSNLIFFCISGIIGPIEFKCCMHIECDQAIIS